jgi:AcrR family transcriptional regulator
MAAKELFLAHGYSKVTMGEVAAELGMSKKTLYQHFSSKKELFRETLLGHVRLIGDGLGKIVAADQPGFVQKLRRVLLFTGENIPRPSPAFFRDLQRDVREVWEEVDQARLKLIRRHFSKLFQEGAEHGYLRSEIDLSLLILVLGASVQRIMNPDTLSHLPMTAGQVFEGIVDILCRGVLTEEGIEHDREARRQSPELKS